MHDTLEIPEVVSNEIAFIPKWKEQIIDSSLRSFVNLTSAAHYETEWSKLSKMVEIINVNQEKSSHKGFIWNNTWQVLKKWQGKNCISMKKSKGLLFRIKCINSTLPTKDICFLRNPTLYKNQRCIACLRNNKSLYHIAECEIYVKI